MASVNLNIAPPFVLIRVMLLVHTNTSCRYKQIEPRYIRLTKIVLAVILVLKCQLIVYSIPLN